MAQFYADENFHRLLIASSHQSNGIYRLCVGAAFLSPALDY